MKKTIVCFGDSNTHGYQASTGGRFRYEERWTGLLQEYLGTDYLIREEGMSGRTTVFSDPLFEGLNGLEYIYPCLMTHEPVDLLLIMLGTNDMKQRFGVNAANIAKGLSRLASKAIASPEAWRDGKPNLLLIAPPPIDPAYEKTPVVHEMGLGCAEKSIEFAAHFRLVAENLNCHFLDAGTIPDIGMVPIDHMHLNARSHVLLARRLAQVIPACF